MSIGKGIMKTITGIRNEMKIGNEHVQYEHTPYQNAEHKLCKP
jgi:hypothetical protein